MSAEILPFPLARRHRFIRRHARHMAVLPAASAERHLSQQLGVQERTLTKRGIAKAIVDREIEAMGHAIRNALPSFRQRSGGTA